MTLYLSSQALDLVTSQLSSQSEVSSQTDDFPDPFQRNDFEFNFRTAEQLHDYLCTPQDDLPVGVRYFPPSSPLQDESDLKPLVIIAGLHSGEIAPGVMSLLPVIAAHQKGMLQQPVYVISAFPERSADFLRQAQQIMPSPEERTAEQEKAINDLVRQVRKDEHKHDPNRLSKTILDDILAGRTESYHYSSTYNRIAELMPILQKAHSLIDIHSATAPFVDDIRTMVSPEIQEKLHPSLIQSHQTEPRTINTMTPVTEENVHLLRQSPIRRLVNDMLQLLVDLQGPDATTLKEFVATDHTMLKADDKFVVGIEAGHHYTEEAFHTASNFVTMFMRNAGIAKIDELLNNKNLPKETGHLIEAQSVKFLKIPTQGDWKLADGAGEYIKKHGHFIDKGTPILQNMQTGETKDMPIDGTILFPPHELNGKEPPYPNGSRIGVVASVTPNQYTSKNLLSGPASSQAMHA